MDTPQNLGPIGGFIFLIVGGLLLYFANHLAEDSRYLKANGISATATVIEHRRKVNKEGNDSYTAVFRFYDNDRMPQTFTPGFSSSLPWYKRNRPYEVLYDPLDHQNVRVNDFMGMWFGPAALMVMGLVFCLSGLYGVTRWVGR